MNCFRFPLLLTCFLLGMLVASAKGAEKWTMPDLNPFNNSHSKAPAPTFSNPLKLPKLDLHLPKLPSKPAKGPSAWDKFSQGTKDFFGKTKEALTPGSKKSTGSAWKFEGFQTGGKKQEKESFLSKLLPSKEETPRRPKSPADFLKQPRPQ